MLRPLMDAPRAFRMRLAMARERSLSLRRASWRRRWGVTGISGLHALASPSLDEALAKIFAGKPEGLRVKAASPKLLDEVVDHSVIHRVEVFLLDEVADDLVLHHHVRRQTSPPTRLISRRSLVTRFKPALDEFMVLLVDTSEILPMSVDV
jgi:hypothetical protein